MITPKAGFIVYGAHKDGLEDPLGKPFIDENVVRRAKASLKSRGVELLEHPTVVASKREARAAFKEMKDRDDVDCVILFAGTWVWAANLVAAVRDYSMSGRGILLWTHPGSRGWRPVGGLVMHGALLEIGVPHRFVYGGAEDAARESGTGGGASNRDPGREATGSSAAGARTEGGARAARSSDVDRVVSYLKACRLKRTLNMSTIGAFGGRGMGQTCGAADPSQWMRTFGVDIDTRDTTELIRTAEKVGESEIAALEPRLRLLFGKAPAKTLVNERSIRLYLALKKLVHENGFDFYTIQSFPGLADDFAATCFAQSMMLEDGHGTSTLGDFNTALSTLLLARLSGERVYYGDLQHIDKASGEIKIVGDGACPPSLAGKLGPAGFAEHGIPTEGGAGGLSVRLICKVGEGALARLGRVRGEFRMVIVPVGIFEPPAERVEERLNECGIPFWPHGFVTARCDMEELVQSWTNEYAVLGYGADLVPSLVDFCELTGIEHVLP
jgi:L-fucose isomerase-like protein